MMQVSPQERTLQLINRNYLLQEIVQVEPVVLEILVEAARVPPSPEMTRWDAYEALKRQCDSYIGWGARKEQLATSHHYEAFIDLIDTLLPEEDEYYGHMLPEGIA